MHPFSAGSRRRGVFATSCAIVLAMACTATAHGAPTDGPPLPRPSGEPTFRLAGVIIAAGGIDRARSACFDLASTIAQPVSGRSSGGGFNLTVGFLDDLDSRDSLLRSSFEGCQP